MPDFNGSVKSKQDEDQESKSSASSDNYYQKPKVIETPEERAIDWRNKDYWKLPEHVRNAIDTANIKSRHSQFYNRLQNLNDKIYVFRDVFYTRIPTYQ